MEGEPSDENVSYMDEHPEAKKRVWLRRLNAERQMGTTALTHLTEIIPFPRDPNDPNDAA